MARPRQRRLAASFALFAAAPFLAAAISPGRIEPQLGALGWRQVDWQGIPPARFEATSSLGIRIRARGQASFIFRPMSNPGPGACLAWRWRVDAGPPATDLTRRGGDDRAVALAVGFTESGPQAGIGARAQMAIAQAAAGDHRLPRSVLSYAWGGTGREVATTPRGFFPSPWSLSITRIRILRTTDAARGQWLEERVDLTADWRAAFGGAQVPPLQEVAIATDSEDTGSTVDAQVENIRLVPC